MIPRIDEMVNRLEVERRLFGHLLVMKASSHGGLDQQQQNKQSYPPEQSRSTTSDAQSTAVVTQISSTCSSSSRRGRSCWLDNDQHIRDIATDKRPSPRDVTIVT